MIHRLAKIIPSTGFGGHGKDLRVGIGDDAAVLRPSRSSELVISCDSSLEGVHFHPGNQPPESVGFKSLARAASDLAAMGAIPSYFLLTLALPKEKTGNWLNRFAKGMARGAREFKIRLIGGDISRANGVMLSITVLGVVAPGKAVLRSGARPGDLICVSGKLGRAQLGLEIILRGLSRSPSLKELVRPHFYPKIRLELGHWLASHQIASAMMDLSDGLSTDLPRLCQASGVGARIFEDKIPRIEIPRQLSNQKLNPLDLALHGGEDYELLFTVPPSLAPRLDRTPGAASLKIIGEITSNREILLVARDGTSSRLPSLGWDHFRAEKRIRG
ncbi:MAG TPA: thiamine-phosphate kinase [Candidatus Acidoferrales bacterium]|nr:thiamine-phosphate kinase [Candidatus Acidoferrales bacterium]